MLQDMMESNRLRLRAELSREWLNCRTKYGKLFVPPEQIGILPIRLMIVGESPAENEVELSRPFVGYSGNIMRQKLSEYRYLKRGWSVYITNAVKTAKFDSEGKNVNPLMSEIDSWRRILYMEIVAYNPDAVLILGSSAFYGVVGESVGSISSTNSKYGRKQFVWNDLSSNPMLFLTYHPSALWRQESYHKRYYETWHDVALYLKGDSYE